MYISFLFSCSFEPPPEEPATFEPPSEARMNDAIQPLRSKTNAPALPPTLSSKPLELPAQFIPTRPLP